MKKRIIAWLFLLVGTTVTIALEFSIGEKVATGTIAGAYTAVLATALLIKLLKDDFLYYSILVFVFAASPMGSIINLYRRLDAYDKLVHFFSGLLLAAIEALVVKYLFRCAYCIELERYSMIILAFAFLVSSAGAGIWEIFEYAADKLAGGGMQRGMVDTVTDMIAGNIGGIVYCLIYYFSEKRASQGKPLNSNMK